MKKLFIIACVIVASFSQAQTRSGAYNRVVTDRWSIKADKSVALTWWHNGTINVTDKLIIIDSAYRRTRQVYAIVGRSDVQEYDYDDTPGHYGIQFVTLLYPTRFGMKMIKGYLLFGTDKKTITDLVLKKDKRAEVTYTFNTD